MALETPLRTKDIMTMFSISRSTLSRWVNENSIPYYRVFAKVYFDKKEIEEWTNTKKVPVKVSGK